MISEGASVRYIGDGFGREAGLVLDDQGKVVASTPTHSHVSWRTGALSGQVVLISNMDLVVAREATVTDDALDGKLVTISARQAYEAGGARRLLSVLSSSGHTTGFASIAEEVFSLVASRIRQDPSFRLVLAELGDDEASDLVSLASASLLRDAFSEAS